MVEKSIKGETTLGSGGKLPGDFHPHCLGDPGEKRVLHISKILPAENERGASELTSPQ